MVISAIIGQAMASFRYCIGSANIILKGVQREKCGVKYIILNETSVPGL